MSVIINTPPDVVTNTEVMLPESGALEFKRGWENQELVYGLFQGMCLLYVVIMQIVR